MNIIHSSLQDIDSILQRYEEGTAYQKIVAPKHWIGFERSLVETAILEQRQYNIMDEGEIACVFTLTFEDLLIWKEKNADPAIYIHRIATNPSFRGRGYTQTIVAWAKAYAQKHGKAFIRMDTGSGNEKLNQYYIRCGFSYLGTTEMGEADDLPAHYKNNSFSLFEIKLDKKMHVQLAKSPDDIAKCTRVMLELRPHIAPESFVALVQQMMGEGYQLAFIEENGEAVSAIGFRYLQFLYCGKHFYIDDLTTLADQRGKGHAGALLDYVADRARAEGFAVITLDSGHHRFPAHRLYLNKGFDITAHHFVKKV